MAQIDLMTVFGTIAIVAIALTFLIPLVIAFKNCRLEKRRRAAGFHPDDAHHLLS